MSKIAKESMAGFLAEYANPSLIEQEKTAWQQAMVDKYGNEKDYHNNALEMLNNLSYYLFIGEKIEIDFNELK